MIKDDKDKVKLDEKIYQKNVYYQNDPIIFMKFIQILIDYPTCYGKMLKKSRFQHINNWLHLNLKFLDNEKFNFEDYNYSEIVHLILNSMTNFPICPVCGKIIDSPKKIFIIWFYERLFK